MTMPRVEVITSVERRRRWSRDEKESLVAASFEPGVSVSEIARSAGIHVSQLFRWRKDLCERVQAGLSSHNYAPGPLSEYEMPVKDMHARLRNACPVVTLTERPMDGTLRRLNQEMLAETAALGGETTPEAAVA